MRRSALISPQIAGQVSWTYLLGSSAVLSIGAIWGLYWIGAGVYGAAWPYALICALTASVAVIVGVVAMASRLARANTRLVEVQATCDYLENILDSMPDGAVVSSREGRVRGVNPAFCVLLGKSEADLVGTASRLLFEDEIDFKGAATARPEADELVSGAPVERCETTLISGQGARIPVRVSWVPVYNRVVTDDVPERAIMITVQDITDRHRAEDALQAAKDAAEASDRSKGEFLANMSHEVRTPMVGVLGAARLLLESELPSQQRTWVETIRQSSEALLAIVNDILDFSKIEAGMLSFERVKFEMAEILSALHPIFIEPLRHKDVRLIISIDRNLPKLLRGDPGRLRQVLINLINNAIKFTETGEVRVEALPEAESSKSIRVRFSVRDTGCGIAADVLPDLFKPFTQAHESSNLNVGGTGLGLAISKQLVERMHGRLKVDSEIGVGSTFRFTARFEKVLAGSAETSAIVPVPALGESAPVRARARARARARSVSNNASVEIRSQYRILIAEDNLVNQQIAREMLTRRGYLTDVVGNGREAVEAVSRIRYAAVLMDCQMPIMDGYQATAEIRRCEDGWRVPIIAMTAHAMQGDREKCLAAGMDDYMSKPVEVDILEAMLDRLVGIPLPTDGDEVDNDALPAQSRRSSQSRIDLPPGASVADFQEDSLVDFDEDNSYSNGHGRIDSPPENELSALESIKQVSPSAFVDIVDIYLEQTTSYLDELTTAIAVRESEKLQRVAHSCKGASANCGAMVMSRLMTDLESLGRQQKFDNAKMLLAQARIEFQRVKAMLLEETQMLKNAESRSGQ